MSKLLSCSDFLNYGALWLCVVLRSFHIIVNPDWKSFGFLFFFHEIKKMLLMTIFQYLCFNDKYSDDS